MHGSRALSYVAGPSIGGLLVQALTAPVTLVVDACSYVVSALFLRSVEAEEPPPEAAGQGPRRRRRPLGLRQLDRPGRARRDGDDQLLQLRLLRALHPLRDEVARHRRRGRSGSCSEPAPSAVFSARSSPAASPAGSESGRRSPSAASSSPRRSCSCRSPVGPRWLVLGVPLPRRVRLRARRDDARHQRRRDLRRGDPGPAALTRRPAPTRS